MGERPADITTQPASSPATAVAAGGVGSFQRMVFGRRSQHSMALRLAKGSIADAEAPAYVLGVFREVEPAGPARELDHALGGAVREFSRRRMFCGNVGEIFIMPTGRHLIHADHILFAGLGHFDRFHENAESILQTVAENVMRTCVRTGVDEFATVLVGANSGCGVRCALANLLTGFFRGLCDADRDHRFHRVTLCELDDARHDAIRAALIDIGRTWPFADVEVTFDERRLVPPLAAVVAEPTGPRGPGTAYLIVRQESTNQRTVSFRTSLLSSRGKAAVVSEAVPLRAADLDRYLRKIETPEMTVAELDRYGDGLARLLLPEAVRGALHEMQDRHLVVVHDAAASRVPWETLRIGDWSPAASATGLSRQYLADNLTIAKWLQQRQHGPVLDILLVVNPTGDLPGAEEEGGRVRRLFDSSADVRVDEFRGERASRAALLERFQSGEYDVIHYAGHAYFDPADPARSGIYCHGRAVLSGADLAGIGNLPSLVFFNACEAGRIRRGGPGRSARRRAGDRLTQSIGLAEAFLRGGVANYVGTWWPVGDAPALAFAETFYQSLVAGKPIGAALAAGRHRIRSELRSIDWADYLHYGSYDFALKQG